MLEYIGHVELYMLDINSLLELIILDWNPITNIPSNSPNELIFKFPNISPALLHHGIFMRPLNF